MGEGTRLAAATGAWIVFEDEAGQNLRPPKARTWAPRGHTPVVRVCGKGSGRVSVAGLVCLKWVAPLIRRGFVSEACEVDGAGGVEGFLGCAHR